MNTYEYRKMQGKCGKCGEQDSYTMMGRALCFECCEKAKESAKKYMQSDAYLDYLIKRRDRRAQRKEKGVCVDCGKAISEKGRVRCDRCLEYSKQYSYKRRHKDASRITRDIAPDVGICMRCLKAPVRDGGKLCDACYDKAVKNLAYGRSCKRHSKPLLFGKKLYGEAER